MAREKKVVHTGVTSEAMGAAFSEFGIADAKHLMCFRHLRWRIKMRYSRRKKAWTVCTELLASVPELQN